MSTKKYLPRNDFVLVRIINLGKSEKGILMPDGSQIGKKLVVEAIGPDIMDLKVGDSVLMSQSSDTFPLPGHNDLFAVKQEAIAMVVDE